MCFSVKDGKLPVAANQAIVSNGMHNAPNFGWPDNAVALICELGIYLLPFKVTIWFPQVDFLQNIGT